MGVGNIAWTMMHVGVARRWQGVAPIGHEISTHGCTLLQGGGASTWQGPIPLHPCAMPELLSRRWRMQLRLTLTFGTRSGSPAMSNLTIEIQGSLIQIVVLPTAIVWQ